MKSKLIVEHVPTGRTWAGYTKEIDDEQFEQEKVFCRSVSKGAGWMSLEVIPASGESTVHISGNILKDCVIYLNTDQ